MVKNTARWNRS